MNSIRTEYNIYKKMFQNAFQYLGSFKLLLVLNVDLLLVKQLGW